jgi:hypothetical protein
MIRCWYAADLVVRSGKKGKTVPGKGNANEERKERGQTMFMRRFLLLDPRFSGWLSGVVGRTALVLELEVRALKQLSSRFALAGDANILRRDPKITLQIMKEFKDQCVASTSTRSSPRAPP